MSTLKAVNLQHPSAANVNISFDTNGISNDLRLSTAPFYGAIPWINSDFTVANTYNYMTPGPVSVANNVTLTVANGATWTVV